MKDKVAARASKDRYRAKLRADPKRWEEEKAKCRVRNAAYRKANPVRLQHWERRKRYGMTAEEYERMYAEQQGLCAICSRPPQGKHPLHVDHDHTTGKVRGLLCHNCNAMLGHAQDDPNRLRNGLLYLGVKR